MASKRRQAPRGSGLSWYPNRGARGSWVWRKVHPKTGKRLWRDTKQHRLTLALREAARFDDELREELAGIKHHNEWQLSLLPLVAEWILDQEGRAQPSTLERKRKDTERALDLLKLRTAADLLDVAGADQRLKSAIRARRIPSWQAARRAYQVPLKQFARWLAGNQRYLDRDPMVAWEAIPTLEGTPRGASRRAVTPEELARALAAVDVLDRAHARRHPQRLTLTVMLVTAPRPSALCSRDVGDFRAGRIYYGQDMRKKRKGAGALDPTTAQELEAAIAGRGGGPLVPSPRGARYDAARLLDVWQEAFSLGLLDELWPPWAPQDVDLALLVNRSLIGGKVRVSKGGNPALGLRDDTREERAEQLEFVTRVVGEVRQRWADRRAGVDAHGFRMTHRTWAEAAGVPPVVIDKQLGHSGRQSERARRNLELLAGSETGRRHYLDRGSALFDPTRSAVAVRAMLDDAQALLRDRGSALLFARPTLSLLKRSAT